MCKYQKCPMKTAFQLDGPVQIDKIIANSDFYKEIRANQWKKYLIIATLKCIHKKHNLEPAVHPFYSLEVLAYADSLNYKIGKGLEQVKFNDIYDEWVKKLSEMGILYPIWNADDINLSKK